MQVEVGYFAGLEHHKIPSSQLQYNPWFIKAKISPNALSKSEHSTQVLVPKIPMPCGTYIEINDETREGLCG